MASTRLRAVGKDERKTPVRKRLRALQAFTVMLSDGTEALGIINAEDGGLYFTGSNGWTAMDMAEEEYQNDSKI